MDTLHEYVFTFMTISLNYSHNKKCFKQIYRENKNTHFMFRDFSPENRALYKIMSKNMVQSSKAAYSKSSAHDMLDK